MLTSLEYMVIWGIYGVTAIIAMYIVTRMTHSFPRQLRGLANAFIAVLLFTPWFVHEGQRLMAPAIIILAFDNLVQDQAYPLRALMPLAVSSFGACLFLVFQHLIVSRFRKQEV